MRIRLYRNGGLFSTTVFLTRWLKDSSLTKRFNGMIIEILTTVLICLRCDRIPEVNQEFSRCPSVLLSACIKLGQALILQAADIPERMVILYYHIKILIKFCSFMASQHDDYLPGGHTFPFLVCTADGVLMAVKLQVTKENSLFQPRLIQIGGSKIWDCSTLMWSRDLGHLRSHPDLDNNAVSKNLPGAIHQY